MRLSHCGNPFRLFGWTLITILLMALLFALRAEQAPVILYKLCLVTAGAVLGYWIDRALFPYARPHLEMPAQYEDTSPSLLPSLFPALLMIRRTIVVFACILGLTLGL